jgi:uncharacterized protein DUF998
VLPRSDAALYSPKRPKEAILYRFAIVGLLAFVVIVGTEHLLNLSLDPLEHQVSEYVHTGSGALMIAGFIALACSLAATAMLALRSGNRFIAALFALAALGMAMVALFPTETVAGELPPGRSLTATGRLHDLGSGMTTVALLATAASILAAGDRPRSLRLTAANLVLSALIVSAALLIVGPAVGGVRQRLLLLIGCFWQFAFLRSTRTGSGCGGDY